MTRKYRVIIEQAIDVEVDIDRKSTRTGDIKYIKEELKDNPPHIAIYGSDIRYSTEDLDTEEPLRKMKFKRITKIADYTTCPKCKGTRILSITCKDLTYKNEYEAENCYRCNGSGKVIKKRIKND